MGVTGSIERLCRRVSASSADRQVTYEPFTGEPIAAVPLSSPDDVAAAAEQARFVQPRWASTPPVRRAEVLLRFHDLVLDRQEEILDLVQRESGKVRLQAFEEVAHVAMTARYLARRAGRVTASSRRLGLIPGLTRVDVHRHPVGLVGVISPWNYPFSMALADGLAAIAAGNAVLHKPDTQTAMSALFGVELLETAGLPAGLWQVVCGDGPVVGPAVVDVADKVCFTGSTRTGRDVGVRAASHLVDASLELGGKNPMLVLRDADVERAADIAVRACFASAGQLCVSIERLYVADQIHDAFVSALLTRIEGLRLSAELAYGGDMGSLVSAAQLERVERHVGNAVAKGARVLAGGVRRPDVGPLFYAPTVLAGVEPDMACFAEETFGPVVSIYRFTDEADAVARANEGRYGLHASVVTRDARRGRVIARRIRCGSVDVNEGYAASFGSIDAPMGGMRDSGRGRRQGSEGLLRFTEPQAVATQRLLPLRPVLGIGEERYAELFTALMRGLRRVRRP